MPQVTSLNLNLTPVYCLTPLCTVVPLYVLSLCLIRRYYSMSLLYAAGDCPLLLAFDMYLLTHPIY